jgi:exodeoxyribonuclease VII large subunit
MPDFVDDAADTGTGTEVFSLSEIAGLLKVTLARTFDSPVWVKAEIAKMNVYSGSGHCYLDLVEKEGKVTRAQFRGIMWAADYEYVAQKFSAVTKQDLSGGMYVLFLARMNFHPVYGLSLWITDVEPSFTLGEMERLRQATIARLKKEGLFDRNRSLPVPMVPQRLAVISAASSKGYADFLNILASSTQRYRFEITLFPAFLQGDRAADSIIGQMNKVGQKLEQFDLLLIIRGGGDEIGLTCFDQEDLVRKLCSFPLPVVTGIGHSTNETIAEMVACCNKITPTDVAYFLVGLFDTFMDSIETLDGRVSALALAMVEKAGEKLSARSQMLYGAARGRLRHEATHLDFFSEKIVTTARHAISGRLERIAGFESRVTLLDPVNTLRRGYSLTLTSSGQPIRSSGEVTKGDHIRTLLSEGSMESIVEKTETSDQ